MHLYLVRHSKAGRRQDWDGPDEQRPLSEEGRRQADALLRVLADRNIRRILSSSYVRCIQTVQPLADKLGIPVETTGAATEGAKRKDALGMVRGIKRSGTVICSHGDVIPTILDALIREDRLDIPPDYPCAKGSTWDLRGRGGRYLEARYIPPPA